MSVPAFPQIAVRVAPGSTNCTRTPFQMFLALVFVICHQRLCVDQFLRENI